MASSGPKSEGDSSSRLWRYLRNIWFGDSNEPTLREQIEEVIDEAEEDAEIDTQAAREGDLSRVEREMLRNMLNFGEQTADDVAVPRGDIIAIDENASFDDVVALFAEADHSRLPVYRDSLDNVIGMLHVKDVFSILARKEPPPAKLGPLMRQPLYVPQSMSAMELLAEMRAKRTHLAIVLDEYAGTDGLLTIEDLMEEIVGDIEDEHDEAPQDLLIPVGLGCWDVDARIELEELAERLDPRLAEVEGDVDTLGGLAFVLAGHVPQPTEVLTHPSGWTIEIRQGDERRVVLARLREPDAHSGPSGA
ncbi:HlyC/CorC family transporter [Sphingomonas lacunae]|uniref:HlyC/CorC family transporter n=1 Tax=Sphingomonas lacunae TaxID=2698828 RepID=A0A6M4AXG6_9SPHN|nr:hemolysin family protein [Sphingomonas lacunae]QJQ32739.1 HlyC/CorC family transporter [Sphingomonas lacunae]